MYVGRARTTSILKMEICLSLSIFHSRLVRANWNRGHSACEGGEKNNCLLLVKRQHSFMPFHFSLPPFFSFCFEYIVGNSVWSGDYECGFKCQCCCDCIFELFVDSFIDLRLTHIAAFVSWYCCCCCCDAKIQTYFQDHGIEWERFEAVTPLLSNRYIETSSPNSELQFFSLLFVFTCCCCYALFREIFGYMR